MGETRISTENGGSLVKLRYKNNIYTRDPQPTGRTCAATGAAPHTSWSSKPEINLPEQRDG